MFLLKIVGILNYYQFVKKQILACFLYIRDMNLHILWNFIAYKSRP